MSKSDPANDKNAAADTGKKQAEKPPEVIQKVDKNELQRFVTAIKSAEQQVGENIIRALSHDDTVAVLTTVVMGPSGQQLVSAALNPKMMMQVQQMLMAARIERKEVEQCMGFHCFIEPADNDEDDDASSENKGSS